MNKKHWLIRTAIFALAAFVLIRVYYTLTDDFRISNIHYPLPQEGSWTIPALSRDDKLKLNQILGQHFFYLGKGAQSYAFESEDHQYVLKFFKFKHLRPSLFIDFIPPVGPLQQYKEKQTLRKERKLFGVFNAYRLAYDVDKEDSGLIYIQLNGEGNPPRTVQVVDKIGLTRSIELQNIPFIVQKKGVMLRNVLSELLKKGDIQLAMTRIGQIFDMYAREYEKGIYDHDHGVMQNTGFVGIVPIHLDVGKLVKEDKMRDKSYAKDDLLLVAEKIKTWVKTNFPKDYAEIASGIDKKIEESWIRNNRRAADSTKTRGHRGYEKICYEKCSKKGG